MDNPVTRLIVFLGLLLACVNSVSAHDIWLLPERFTLARGDILRVRQLAGSELGDALELPLLKRLTPRFRLLTDERDIDLLAGERVPTTENGPRLVVQRTLDFDGLALLTMEHDVIEDEFPTEKFLEHLKHEGYSRERFQDRLGDRPIQSERYRRTLKSLIRVGKVTTSDLYQRVLEQTIEIVPTSNPYRLNPGDDLALQVLFKGEPLTGQPVMAFHKGPNGKVSKQQTETDPAGQARFKLEQPGIWLIRLVHIRPCTGNREDCADIDWESFWSSLTFELD